MIIQNVTYILGSDILMNIIIYVTEYKFRKDTMEKPQFKHKCKICKQEWILVKPREPAICQKCKTRYEKQDK